MREEKRLTRAAPPHILLWISLFEDEEDREITTLFFLLVFFFPLTGWVESQDARLPIRTSTKERKKRKREMISYSGKEVYVHSSSIRAAHPRGRRVETHVRIRPPPSRAKKVRRHRFACLRIHRYRYISMYTRMYTYAYIYSHIHVYVSRQEAMKRKRCRGSDTPQLYTSKCVRKSPLHSSRYGVTPAFLSSRLFFMRDYRASSRKA